MLASVASTAAKHSAALVLFTTLLMRRLCHARRQYDPYLSHRKVTYAPCDPLSGRLAKLASVNVTILQAVWSTLVGKRRATSCPFTFRITLLAVYKSCTQASLMELATVQLSNAQSGLECVAIQLICPESCLRQVFSVGNRGLSRLVPVSPRSISLSEWQYPLVERWIPFRVCDTIRPRYFIPDDSSVPTVKAWWTFSMILLLNVSVPPYRKSSTCITMIPSRSPDELCQTNTAWSMRNCLPPRAFSSFTILRYQCLPASAKPYGHFFRRHSLLVWAHFGGLMYISRLIGIPCR